MWVDRIVATVLLVALARLCNFTITTRRKTTLPNTNSLRTSTFGSKTGGSCASRKGIVIVGLLDELEFNLLEIAFARRLAEELCWDLVVRPHWNVGFGPAERECFPMAVPVSQIVPSDVGINDTIWAAIQYQPPNLRLMDTTWDENNVLVSTWAKELENVNKESWTCIAGCAFSEIDVQHVLASTRSTTSNRRVIYLENFFTHHEWLLDWRLNVASFLEINPSCLSASPPPEAVVIHILSTQEPDTRFETFQIEGQEYERLLQKYELRGNPVWVVCDVGCQDTPVAVALRTSMPGLNVKFVHPTNPTDAIGILSKAKILVVTPNSLLSTVAAVLTNGAVVHYPTSRTANSMYEFSLAMPEWKYHTVVNGKFASWDVPHKNFNF